jgi:hypothetical protein
VLFWPSDAYLRPMPFKNTCYYSEYKLLLIFLCIRSPELNMVYEMSWVNDGCSGNSPTRASPEDNIRDRIHLRLENLSAWLRSFLRVVAAVGLRNIRRSLNIGRRRKRSLNGTVVNSQVGLTMILVVNTLI